MVCPGDKVQKLPMLILFPSSLLHFFSHSVGGTSWDSSEADEMFEPKKKVNVGQTILIAATLSNFLSFICFSSLQNPVYWLH